MNRRLCGICGKFFRTLRERNVYCAQCRYAAGVVYAVRLLEVKGALSDSLVILAERGEWETVKSLLRYADEADEKTYRARIARRGLKEDV